MSKVFPGTVIETTAIEKESSKRLFDGIFAAGGITLSQVSVMTNLEPYLIQNWVKRGFLTSPQKRMYSKDQFARILIINMLRETLQIEKICELIKIIGGLPEDPDDDMISDSELYHRYVDMISDMRSDILGNEDVKRAAQLASEDFVENIPNSRQKLERILEIMLYAQTASTLKKKAEEIFSTLQ